MNNYNEYQGGVGESIGTPPIITNEQNNNNNNTNHEDPSSQSFIELLKVTREAFETREDIAVLDRISTTLGRIQQRRSATIDTQLQLLRNLSRQLEVVKNSVNEQETEIHNATSMINQNNILVDEDQNNNNNDDDNDINISNSNEPGTFKKQQELVLKLDKKKFNLAKSITDLETANDISSALLMRLNEELERLLDEDVLETSTADIQDSSV